MEEARITWGEYLLGRSGDGQEETLLRMYEPATGLVAGEAVQCVCEGGKEARGRALETGEAAQPSLQPFWRGSVLVVGARAGSSWHTEDS